MRAKFMSIGLLLALTAVPGFAQLSPSAKWATESAAQYTMNANITYRTASNQQLKMDVYYRRGVTTPQPTLVYMHGGFWVAGAKETAIYAIITCISCFCYQKVRAATPVSRANAR